MEKSIIESVLERYNFLKKPDNNKLVVDQNDFENLMMSESKWIGGIYRTPFRSYLPQNFGFLDWHIDHFENIDQNICLIGGCVYFIKVDDFIKIGKAKNIFNRFDSIDGQNPGNPMILVCIPFKNMETSSLYEKVFHRYFNDLQHKKEWFYYTKDLKELCLNLKPLSLNKKGLSKQDKFDIKQLRLNYW